MSKSNLSSFIDYLNNNGKVLNDVFKNRRKYQDKMSYDEVLDFLKEHFIPIANKNGFDINFNDCFDNTLTEDQLSKISGGLTFHKTLGYLSLATAIGAGGFLTAPYIIPKVQMFGIKSDGGFELPKLGEFDNLETSTIFNYAVKNYYSKYFPKYEDIIVKKDDQKVKWKSLSVEEQFRELKNGATGQDKKVVEEKENEYKKFIQTGKSEEEVEKFAAPMIRQLVEGNSGSKFSVVHGPKHCIRTGIIAEAVARLYRTLFYEFENMSDEEIKLAVTAAAFHDSGRQADYIDIFDTLSGQNAADFLSENGISEHHQERVKSAVEHKDSEVKDKDRIAIVVHEGDCLEYQRIYDRPYDAKYLDVNAKKPDGKRVLTPKHGITEQEIQDKINTLILNIRRLIIDTKNYEEEPKSVDSSSQYYKILEMAKSYDMFNPYVTHNFYNPDKNYKNQKKDLKLDKINEASDWPYELFGCRDVYKRSEEILKFSGTSQKVERAKDIAKFCLKLRDDGFKESFVGDVCYHRLKMSQDGIFDNMSNFLAYKNRKFLDKNNKEYDNIRGFDGLTGSFANYLSHNGGSFSCFEAIMSGQSTSSWSPISVAVKTFVENQLEKKQNFFYPDNTNPATGKTLIETKENVNSVQGDNHSFKKSRNFGGFEGRQNLLNKFRKLDHNFYKNTMLSYYIGTNEGFAAKHKIFDIMHFDPMTGSDYSNQDSIFDQTIMLNYAMTQEMLSRIDLPFKHGDEITLFRRCDKENMKNIFSLKNVDNIPVNSKGRLKNTAVYDSTSLAEAIDYLGGYFPKSIIEIKTPLHRVFGTFFLSHLLEGFTKVSALDDSEISREFVTMTEGLEATYVGEKGG